MESEARVCSSLLAHHLRQVGDDAGGEEHRAVLPVWLLHPLLGHLLHQRSPQTKLEGVAGWGVGREFELVPILLGSECA